MRDSAGATPLVSLVACAYNEVELAADHLDILWRYPEACGEPYRWEMVLVDDGSVDGTGAVLETFARSHAGVRVLRHTGNLGVGAALRTAIGSSRGEYVVIVDLDLSYSPEHIGRLLARLRATGAAVVVASPYMPGGCTANVPWDRLVTSRVANWLLSLTTRRRLATLTGMVRAYDGVFLRSLPLEASDKAINLEILDHALRRRALVEEIPACLDWSARRRAPRARWLRRGFLREIATVLRFGARWLAAGRPGHA